MKVDDIEFSHLPTAVTYRTWWPSARDKIVAAVKAAKYHDAALAWVNEVVKHDTTFDRLAESGKIFKQLDTVGTGAGVLMIKA